MARKTKTLTGEKAREAVMRGVNAIYEPVRLTFGPQGRNALLYRTYGRGARITNDGYTVAEVQEPKDPFVQMAAEAFKEMCKRTNEKVGDGTTGTAIFGGVAFNTAAKLVAKGSSFTASGSGMGVMTLRKKILESADAIKEAIRSRAVKVETVEDLEKIATISVEDAELGKTIAAMAWEVGADGFIDTVEGFKGEIETEVIKGMRFPAKIPAKVFVNNPSRYEMVVTDTPVLLTNYALDNVSEVAKVLSELNKKKISKIAIIAPSFSDSVLVNMVKAAKEGGFLIHPIATASLRTEQLEDLAVYFDATFVDKQKGTRLTDTTVENLGFVEKLIVKDTEAKEDAVATGGRGTVDQMYSEKGEDGEKRDYLSSEIAERVKVLKGQLNETRQENFKKLMERRIASMSSAVGIIRVGDSTNASALYLKLKIEDAVYACKAALRGGYVKGGGVCLKEIADEVLGEDDILKEACLAPYTQIQSSVDGGIEIGPDIIDPADAIYYAVEHGAGVAANLITVEILTPEVGDVEPGEGYMAIARAVGEISISMKKNFGQMREGEEEMERDRLQGMTDDERVALDNG